MMESVGKSWHVAEEDKEEEAKSHRKKAVVFYGLW